MPKILYRAGTKEDVPGLILFLRNFMNENPLIEFFEHDLKKSREVLHEILEQDQGVILLAVKNDIIVGAIILAKTSLWWASKDFFTDLVFYVNPEYRGEVTERLIEFTKQFIDDTKLPLVISVFNESEKNGALQRYLSIKGFQNIGFKAMYRPKD